jgi:predicted translin family RNA/ssDNA-binding protein
MGEWRKRSRKPRDSERVVSALRSVVNHVSAVGVAVNAGAFDHAEAQLKQAEKKLARSRESFERLRANAD